MIRLKIWIAQDDIWKKYCNWVECCGLGDSFDAKSHSYQFEEKRINDNDFFPHYRWCRRDNTPATILTWSLFLHEEKASQKIFLIERKVKHMHITRKCFAVKSQKSVAKVLPWFRKDWGRKLKTKLRVFRMLSRKFLIWMINCVMRRWPLFTT